MSIRLHTELADFWDTARALYEADPARHNVSLSILRVALDGGAVPKAMLTVWEDGALAAAAISGGGRPLLLSAVPTRHVAAVAAALAEQGVAIASAEGPRARALAFGRAWAELTGARVRPAMREMLHELGELALPEVSGTPRVAGEADADVIAPWEAAYRLEALGMQTQTTAASYEWLRRALRGSSYSMLLWEDGGRPVAYAGALSPIGGVSRIVPVYVPKELRGNGYGIAVAGAATEWALKKAAAKRAVLFTDLANPTANSIYAKLGYRPVEEYLKVVFNS